MPAFLPRADRYAGGEGEIRQAAPSHRPPGVFPKAFFLAIRIRKVVGDRPGSAGIGEADQQAMGSTVLSESARAVKEKALGALDGIYPAVGSFILHLSDEFRIEPRICQGMRHGEIIAQKSPGGSRRSPRARAPGFPGPPPPALSEAGNGWFIPPLLPGAGRKGRGAALVTGSGPLEAGSGSPLSLSAEIYNSRLSTAPRRS